MSYLGVAYQSFPAGFFCDEILPRHAGPDSDMTGSGPRIRHGVKLPGDYVKPQERCSESVTFLVEVNWSPVRLPSSYSISPAWLSYGSSRK